MVIVVITACGASSAPPLTAPAMTRDDAAPVRRPPGLCPPPPITALCVCVYIYIYIFYVYVYMYIYIYIYGSSCSGSATQTGMKITFRTAGGSCCEVAPDDHWTFHDLGREVEEKLDVPLFCSSCFMATSFSRSSCGQPPSKL